MARALIVGCGCRGRLLGKRLLAEGWQVRGTSRHEDCLTAIEAAGIEPALADPERPGTVLELVGDVTVVLWLLGSAEGGQEALAAIHGRCLERTWNGWSKRRYAASSTRWREVSIRFSSRAGREVIEATGETWRIPISFVFVDPSDPHDWAEITAGAALGLLDEGDESIWLNSDRN